MTDVVNADKLQRQVPMKAPRTNTMQRNERLQEKKNIAGDRLVRETAWAVDNYAREFCTTESNSKSTLLMFVRKTRTTEVT